MINRIVPIQAYRRAAGRCARCACLTLISLVTACHSPLMADPSETRQRNAPEYARAVEAATDAYHRKDLTVAQAKLDEAEGYIPDTFVVANLRGAVEMNREHWDEAAKWFNEALKINPGFFEAQFNLIEIAFRQKRYAEARARFQAMRRKFPRDELLPYKIYLTWLLEKNDPAAEAALTKLKFPGDSPAYYYAHAAWEQAHGREAAALSWLTPARGIFPAKANEIFTASLAEVGLLPGAAATPAPATP